MMCEVRVQCKNKHALAGRKRTRSGSKLPAANSRSGSMKKGIAIGEFEKIVEKTMIFHEILLKIQEIDPK